MALAELLWPCRSVAADAVSVTKSAFFAPREPKQEVVSPDGERITAGLNPFWWRLEAAAVALPTAVPYLRCNWPIRAMAAAVISPLASVFSFNTFLQLSATSERYSERRPVEIIARALTPPLRKSPFI